MRTYESVLEIVGRTPLVRLHRTVPEGPRVYAKVESMNPGGSVKDRIGISLIEAAERDGLIRPGGTIIEGTSGNTGVGLAMAAALKGYEIIFTMPDKMAVEKERLLRAYGAEVVRCPTNVAPDDPRSYYSVAERLSEEIENSFYPNQYFNDANPQAHVRTTGPEIWDDTDGKVTHFVCGVGTGGTISGTGRVLKERAAEAGTEVRVIGVDPKGSMLAHYHEHEEEGPAHQYHIEGIGEDLIPSTVWFDVIDDFVTVHDKESFDMTRRLATEEGLLVGSSSGAALVGVHRAIDEGLIPTDDPDAVVVVLFPDTGERYLSKAFAPAWLRSKGLLPAAKTVGEACVSPIPQVDPTESIERVLAVASARDIPVVAVMEEDEVLGTVRVERLLAAILEDKADNDTPASELIGQAPPTVDEATPLGDAVASLGAHESLVVTQDGRPHGLLTRRLALAHLGRI